MPPPRIPHLPWMQNSSHRFSSMVNPLSSSLLLRVVPRSPPISRRPAERFFATSQTRQNWLIPRRKMTHKDTKGKPRMPTGGSVRGTTVMWGDYGLRMRDHDRRISAAQLKNGEDVIRRRLKGMNYRLYMRIHPSTAVYEKGNESRMGTGKGSFDHWAARVAVSRVIFELTADVHEQVIRDAFRLAANKMPGMWTFCSRRVRRLTQDCNRFI